MELNEGRQEAGQCFLVVRMLAFSLISNHSADNHHAASIVQNRKGPVGADLCSPMRADCFSGILQAGCQSH